MKKIGNCEQSIDISRFKIIETQFDRILAKAKQRPLTNFRQSSTHFQIHRPDFRWTDGRSHFCVNWAIFKPSRSPLIWLFVSMVLGWLPCDWLAFHLRKISNIRICSCAWNRGSPVVYKEVDSAGTHCWGWFASQHWFSSPVWEVWGQNADVSLANTSDVERWESAENAG